MISRDPLIGICGEGQDGRNPLCYRTGTRNKNKRTGVVLWMLRNILSNSHPSHPSSSLSARSVRIRLFVGPGNYFMGKSGRKHSDYRKNEHSLREICMYLKMVQDPEHPIYWDGPMRVHISYLMTGARNPSQEYIYIYQRSRIGAYYVRRDNQTNSSSSPRRHSD